MTQDTLKKFSDPFITNDGSERAYVDLQELKTLWFNTGSRCNLSCENCYIESTPTNDRLSYIKENEVIPYLQEVKENNWPVELIGLTGGEPFLNPEIMGIIEQVLKRDFEVLVLSNAYNVINRRKSELIALKNIYADKLHLRISLDHFTRQIHEKERGPKTFEKTLQNIREFVELGFNISIAGRHLKEESFEEGLKGYKELLKDNQINLDLNGKLVVFPEMDLNKDVPEITTKCWDILSKSPDQQMCASERMIVKKKEYDRPMVMPCTLLAYDEQFDMGHTLKDSKKRVQLNHKFCAQFCVLGGASCSTTK